MIDHHRLRDRVILEEENRQARGRERAAAFAILVAFVVWGFTCYGGFRVVYS